MSILGHQGRVAALSDLINCIRNIIIIVLYHARNLSAARFLLRLYGMWRDSLRSIPPIRIFLVEIRGAGPCQEVDLWFQIAFYLKDMGITGLAPALVMARQRRDEYRRKVEAATRCSGYAPIPERNFLYALLCGELIKNEPVITILRTTMKPSEPGYRLSLVTSSSALDICACQWSNYTRGKFRDARPI